MVAEIASRSPAWLLLVYAAFVVVHSFAKPDTANSILTGEVFRLADADKDDSLTRGEFQDTTQSGYSTETGTDILHGPLRPVDFNINGKAEGVEARRMIGNRDVADQARRLRSRARSSTAKTRRLDEAAGAKVHDARCKAPEGYPTRPEGWVCINDTSLIYCTNGKRYGRESSCGWKGTCKAGLMPDGGCNYPMCDHHITSGSYCLQDTIFACMTVPAHGRTEVQSFSAESCGPGTGCHAWNDGPPPSRRRRTQTCYKGDCHDDPEDPPYAACVAKNCTYPADQCIA
mmetsp:Transcript_61402/g.170252  ORF Transcript_61402/g.170252 Transcript_61402/m.170252 type:complete len:287 (-) Transcript_61402:53-913(-)